MVITVICGDTSGTTDRRQSRQSGLSRRLRGLPAEQPERRPGLCIARLGIPVNTVRSRGHRVLGTCREVSRPRGYTLASRADVAALSRPGDSPVIHVAPLPVTGEA